MGAASLTQKDAEAGGAGANCSLEGDVGVPGSPDGGGGGGPGGGASIAVGAFLLLTATATPSMLGEPYAFAVLGWAPAILLNLMMAVSSLYCMYHQASLYHYKGHRLSTYRAMGEAVLGPRYGPWVEGTQFFINLGTIITNNILGGQMMQCVYTLLCTDSAACTFRSLARWTAIAGAVSWLLVISTRQLAHAGLITAAATAGFAFYSAAAVGMAAADGADKGAPAREYGPVGDGRAAVALNALNGVGILMFLYGITVLPEIQAVLADDPRTGKTTRPMVKAALAAHAGFVPAFLAVGALGYWAYGSAVDPFLLFSTRRPVWLVAAANLVAVLQLQIASLIYSLPMFARLESSLLQRNPGKPWMRPRRRRGSGATNAAPSNKDAAAAASPAASPRAFGGPSSPPVSRRVSSVIAAAGALLPPVSRDASYPARASMLSPRHSLGDPPSPTGLSHSGLPLSGLAPAPASPTGVDDGGTGGNHSEAHGEGGAGTEEEDEVPSWALQLLHRTAWAALWTLVAVAFPFFSSVMGLVGAVGFGPFTYCLPTVLYMRATPMRPLERAANGAFVAFWLAASAAAAVGAVYGIVEASKGHSFFVS